MKVLFRSFVLIWFLFGFVNQMIGQNKPLKYSKFFDSFYRTGDLRYSVEPGFSYIVGDLGLKPASSSFGMGATYRILPPIEVSTGVRYFRMSSVDHNDTRQLEFCGNYYHYNVTGKYFLVYDRIRTNYDRRKKPKTLKMYLTTGLTLMYYNASPTRFGHFYSTDAYAISRTTFQIPFGYGFPIRINDKISLVPEFLYYITNTDLMDGITSFSQNSDHYVISSIKIEYKPATSLISLFKKKKIKLKKKRNEEDLDTDSSNSDSETSE